MEFTNLSLVLNLRKFFQKSRCSVTKYGKKIANKMVIKNQNSSADYEYFRFVEIRMSNFIT